MPSQKITPTLRRTNIKKWSGANLLKMYCYLIEISNNFPLYEVHPDMNIPNIEKELLKRLGSKLEKLERHNKDYEKYITYQFK